MSQDFIDHTASLFCVNYYRHLSNATIADNRFSLDAKNKLMSMYESNCQIRTKVSDSSSGLRESDRSPPESENESLTYRISILSNLLLTESSISIQSLQAINVSTSLHKDAREAPNGGMYPTSN